MNISKIIIQGFRSFSKKQEIDFDDLNGFIFVTGENITEKDLGGNAVGKSTLFEAIVWCLFGKTSTNLKAGEIKNWWSDEKCEVELYTDKGVIKRTWNPNSLKVDDVEISQIELENIINFNFDSFMYSIFISQFGQKFIDFQPEQKMKIFTSIMGSDLEKWVAYSKKASTKVIEQDEYLTNLDKELSNLFGQLKSLNTNKLIEEKEAWEDSRKDRINNLKKDLKDLTTSGFIKDLKAYQDKLKQTTELIDKYEDEVQNIQSSVVNIKSEIESLNKEKYELNLHINKWEDDIDSLNGLNSVCPTCLQKVDSKHLKAEKNKLENLINKNNPELAKLTTKLKTKETELATTNKKINEMTKTIDTLQKEITSIMRDINGLEISIKSEEREKTKLEKEIIKVKNEENPYDKLIKESKSKFILLNRVIVHKEDDFANGKKLYDIYKYWVKSFKEIRLLLLEEALVELEASINNNMKLLGLNDWEICIEVDRENKNGGVKKGFNLTVKSPFNSNPVSFDCWSGGEGQRIRLATTLGLSDFIKNRRSINTNLLILDEPTQFLSEDGIQDLLQLLKEKASLEGLKLFLIDHRDLNTSGLFDSVIKILKDKKGSLVTYEL